MGQHNRKGYVFRRVTLGCAEVYSADGKKRYGSVHSETHIGCIQWNARTPRKRWFGPYSTRALAADGLVRLSTRKSR